MSTITQERWMRLIELLNSNDFDFVCSWFEDADGNQIGTMANRKTDAQHIPTTAHRLRIDGEIWVRFDDWIYQDILDIYNGLRDDPEYLVQIRDGKLYIELAAQGDVS
jgi:hypothetical protein